MIRYIKIDGKNVLFKATASTLTRYANEFNEDALKAFFGAQDELKNSGGFSAESLRSMFNLAYIMAKQADPSIAPDPMEWLDTFDVFDINDVMPQIIELWAESMGTAVPSKKN